MLMFLPCKSIYVISKLLSIIFGSRVKIWYLSISLMDCALETYKSFFSSEEQFANLDHFLNLWFEFRECGTCVRCLSPIASGSAIAGICCTTSAKERVIVSRIRRHCWSFSTPAWFVFNSSFFIFSASIETECTSPIWFCFTEVFSSIPAFISTFSENSRILPHFSSDLRLPVRLPSP